MMFGLKYKQSLHHELFLQDEECTAQKRLVEEIQSRVVSDLGDAI